METHAHGQTKYNICFSRRIWRADTCNLISWSVSELDDINRTTPAPTSDEHFDVCSVDIVDFTLVQTAKHACVFAPYTYTQNTHRQLFNCLFNCLNQIVETSIRTQLRMFTKRCWKIHWHQNINVTRGKQLQRVFYSALTCNRKLQTVFISSW